MTSSSRRRRCRTRDCPSGACRWHRFRCGCPGRRSRLPPMRTSMPEPMVAGDDVALARARASDRVGETVDADAQPAVGQRHGARDVRADVVALHDVVRHRRAAETGREPDAAARVSGDHVARRRRVAADRASRDAAVKRRSRSPFGSAGGLRRGVGADEVALDQVARCLRCRRQPTPMLAPEFPEMRLRTQETCRRSCTLARRRRAGCRTSWGWRPCRSDRSRGSCPRSGPRPSCCMRPGSPCDGQRLITSPRTTLPLLPAPNASAAVRARLRECVPSISIR